MAINFAPDRDDRHLESKPRITVFGVGGAGVNAVNNMISGQLDGVEFVVANTDSQSLVQSLCEQKVGLGASITRGLGAGARPDIGRVAAEEALDEIQSYLEENNMVFITAGMGGGTGTGAGPVIARAAREQGILTVGVVTKPFHFEGTQRMRTAEAGIEEFHQYVDALIVIPNQNLFDVSEVETTFMNAFKMADDVLHAGVRGVTDLMVNPGLINLDFADIRTVMSEMGKAMMGTGEASGEDRASKAVEAAIDNPLLDNASIKGARGVLINITGGADLTLREVDQVASRICSEVDTDANIIFGTSLDKTVEGELRVSVIATGIDADQLSALIPEPSDKVHVLGVSERRNAGADGAPAASSEAHKAVEDTSARSATAVDEALPQARVAAGGADAVSHVEVKRKTVTASAAGAVAPRVSVSDRKPAAATGGMQPGLAGASPAAARSPGAERLGSKGREPTPAPASRPAPTLGNGSGTESEARRPTLFERVTGTGRARRDSPDDAVAASPAAGGGSPDGVRARTPQPPAASAVPARPAAPAPRAHQSEAPAQARDALPLPGLMHQMEEDPLEIPAFLRRQAT